MPLSTFRFRVKDSAHMVWLRRAARASNIVWNYCNETSAKAIWSQHKWLSYFDFCTLMSGTPKSFGLDTASRRSVAKQYTVARDKAKRHKLKWRTRKSLGWIPCGASGKVRGATFTFMKRKFRFWKDREILGKVKTATFAENAQCKWFVSFVCEVPDDVYAREHGDREIGIDLGLKTKAVCSDGVEYNRENLTKRYQERLANAQRAHKTKLTCAIHAKIKASRKDWNDKVSNELCRTSKVIVVGDIGTKELMRTKMAKSISDAGHYQIKSMLQYKASRHGVDFKLVSEKFSTVTCSNCSERSGPSGLSALGVRTWQCSSCGSTHDRDVNAAKNIFKFGVGSDTPIKGDAV